MDFPRAPPRHQGIIELLEIDANTTLSGGWESQNTSINGGQSVGNSSTGSDVDLPNAVALAPRPT